MPACSSRLYLLTDDGHAGALREDLAKAPDREFGAWLDMSLGLRLSH